jgi:hypothetical protein
MEYGARPKNLRTTAPLLLWGQEKSGGIMAEPNRTRDDDKPADRDTLIRLANSCDRAAARTGSASAGMSDLDEEDFRMIARILRSLANS